MDLQRLKTLRELALRGTMAAVSESLHLSPSAVSQQIATLEDAVGQALTERRGRGVQLTEAGRRLVIHAETILQALEEARTDLAALEGSLTGEVRLASFPSMALTLLPALVESLRRDHPSIALTAEESEPLAALTALRGWQCDIAIFDDLSLPEGCDLDRLEVFALFDDELVAVLPRHHRLAARAELPLRALAEEPWALDSRADSFSNAIFALCAQQGFRPQLVARFGAYDVIAAFVARGCAVSVLPRIRVDSAPHPDLVWRPLLPRVARPIRLAVRRGDLARPALRMVVDRLRQAAAALPPCPDAALP